MGGGERKVLRAATDGCKRPGAEENIFQNNLGEKGSQQKSQTEIEDKALVFELFLDGDDDQDDDPYHDRAAGLGKKGEKEA